MKERPIIFNAEMVRAILDGRKGQTRRMLTDKTLHLLDIAAQVGECHPLDQRDERSLPYYQEFCPFGQPGDRLWVRETFAAGLCTKSTMAYRATHKSSDLEEGWDEVIKWQPSIHMPRWASRIQLEITNARVERLNSISEDDAMAEGVPPAGHLAKGAYLTPKGDFATAKVAFQRLWESIYGDESWRSNPWVWVIEFKRVEGGAAC